MPGFDNNTMYADNVDFRGVTPVAPQVTTDGQLLIGSTATPHIKVGSLGSSDGSITWSVGSGTITGQVSGGTTVLKTLTPDSGGAQSPTAGNINALGTGSITTVGSGSTITTQLTGLTNHAVLVGAGTSTITKIGPTATAGQVLQSSGSSADPAFSTATYPVTTTANQILYSSATNTVSGLSSANNGVLTTSGAGVPSIDTTNFQVLSTGVQMKGNNTNTAPPAGFIGEQISSFVSTSVSLTTATPTNITSISVTPGIWDITGIVGIAGALTGTVFFASVNTTSATLGTPGDNRAGTPTMPTTNAPSTLVVPNWRQTFNATTTVYLVASVTYTVGTATGGGRISAVRVG